MKLYELSTGDPVYRYDKSIVVFFKGRRKVLSTSVYNGGYHEDYTAVYNHDAKTAPGMPCEMLADTYTEHMRLISRRIGLDPDKVTGMGTAADMENAAIENTTATEPIHAYDTLPEETMQQLITAARSLTGAFPDAIGWLIIPGTNINYPLMQGGMARISDARLAAAVSNGGGLGIISAASGDVKQIAEQIDEARALTDKPFGVNIMLRGDNIDAIAALIAEKKVAVVTTGAGSPAAYIPMWREAGVKVIPVISTAAMAQLMEKSGADAVVAEGTESGGHVGEMTTMALVPQVCDAVKIPVIAAGGIADGRGFAAALMLGACGVQIGTRFLAATECNISAEYKERLLKAKDSSTVVTGRRLGHPVRSLKSAFSRAYAKVEYTDISDEDLEAMAVGTLRAAVVDGDPKRGCFLAGQISGMVNKEQPAAEIIAEIMQQAEALLK